MVANRYDGIDLVDDECRLLIIARMPLAMNLQERFVVERCASAVLLNERNTNRMVQGFGRCTRSDLDYAVVVVLGPEMLERLVLREKRELLHPELQGEVEFGLEQSKEASPDGLLDLMDHFLGQTRDWEREGNQEIIRLRNAAVQQVLPSAPELPAAVGHEVAYQETMWRGDFEAAYNASNTVLAQLQNPSLDGYRAFWQYLTGAAAWMAGEHGNPGLAEKARALFRRAFKLTANLHWLRELAQAEVDESEADELRGRSKR